MTGYRKWAGDDKTLNVNISSPSILQCDIAIAGAGLAGGLIALALAEQRPDLNILLIDGADRAGGNHIWSFFDSDAGEAGRALLEPLVTYRWAKGHDVRFPSHSRTLDTPYNSISSDQFNRHLQARLGERLMLNCPVAHLQTEQIELRDGRRIGARCVIDARGFFSNICDEPKGTDGRNARSTARDPEACHSAGGHDFTCPAPSGAGLFSSGDHLSDLPQLDCGWQKFVGQTLRLHSPHGLERPIIMDATVDQSDGYRFVYVLPHSPDTVFVEDTYYTDGPELDVSLLRGRIAEYAATQGWDVAAIEHEETGVLPVVKAGDFRRFWPRRARTARAGVRAGLFHPTTGYSLPMATEFALWLADHADLNGSAMARASRCYAARHWHGGGYYRLLSTMLFDAAPPEERYRIFERFYRLPAPLIMRFYSARSTIFDKIRILCGKPPVRIKAAVQAIAKRKRA